MKKRLVLAALAATSLFGGLSASAALGAASHGPAMSDPICVDAGPLDVMGQQVVPYTEVCFPA